VTAALRALLPALALGGLLLWEVLSVPTGRDSLLRYGVPDHDQGPLTPPTAARAESAFEEGQPPTYLLLHLLSPNLHGSIERAGDDGTA
jgi:hypothetical protein